MTSVARLGAEVLRGALDLLFAPRCLGCGGAIDTRSVERLVCAVCWARARRIPGPRCERCGGTRTPLPAGLGEPVGCTLCAELPPYLRAVRSAFVYDGPPRALVHALKYGGWHAVAEPMGRRMAALDWPLETLEEVRAVVPVPVGATRLRQRGYNQAERLARVVARERGWRVETGPLARSGAAGTQTTLHAAERRANVAGAFRVPAGQEEFLRGEHLLLVDDVWTTGATALACARALFDAGARAVSVLTFARALPDPHR